MPDPILARLVADCRRTQDALDAYVNGASTPDDLLTIKQAAHEFMKSEDTIRRWCVNEGLGRKIGGVWFVERSRVTGARRSFA